MSSINSFSFTLEATQGGMRAGTLFTPHGEVKTPIFMPVGTLATVKSLDSQDLIDLKAEIILANAYHLYLRPGLDVIKKAGGIHSFMNWQRPVLTDSGGFQVFSLASNQAQANSLVKISSEGVEFRSHLDGSKHFFTPEIALENQRTIGADIAMIFDQCASDSSSASELKFAVDRTYAWAKRAKAYWQEQGRMNVYGRYQALFGIVQGGKDLKLRKLALEQMLSLDFDGVAFGGETIGYNRPESVRIMQHLNHLIPEDKPRYAMGMGRDPADIVAAVKAGYDMFDCVGPTRLARNGGLFTGKLVVGRDGLPEFKSEFKKGRLNIGNKQFETDHRPLDPNCTCNICRSGYTRSYLHHLYKTKELSFYRLASIHNLHFMLNLTSKLRKFILDS